mgnify:CR=1 FL=1
MKHVLICGGGGFIGHALAKRLKRQQHDVTVIDRKAHPDFEDSPADDYICFDLRRQDHMDHLDQGFDEIYQLAAEVGGLGYINALGQLRFEARNSRLGTTPDQTWGDGTAIYPSAVELLYDPDEYVTSVTARSTVFRWIAPRPPPG